MPAALVRLVSSLDARTPLCRLKLCPPPGAAAAAAARGRARGCSECVMESGVSPSHRCLPLPLSPSPVSLPLCRWASTSLAPLPHPSLYTKLSRRGAEPASTPTTWWISQHSIYFCFFVVGCFFKNLFYGTELNGDFFALRFTSHFLSFIVFNNRPKCECARSHGARLSVTTVTERRSANAAWLRLKVTNNTLPFLNRLPPAPWLPPAAPASHTSPLN